MANFTTHLNVAFAVSAVAGLIAYKSGMVNTSMFLSCVAAGTIGGLLPDLDANNSRPIQLGFDISSLMLAFFLVIHWRTQLSIISLIGLWLMGYITMRYIVFYLFTSMTVHRGIFHSVPYMMCVGLIVTSVSYYGFDVSTISAWFLGTFVFSGAMVHLILDEVYSVDILNQRLKRSSGTALKFFRRNQSHLYIGLYVLVGILWILAPSPSGFIQIVSDDVTWTSLRQELLPSSIDF